MTLPLSLNQCPYKIVLYQARNLVNGKRYIGITNAGLGKRVARHFRTARFSQKGAAVGAAIRKYGQKYIKWNVLAVCPNWEYAKQLEIAAIAAFKPEYNLTKGGDGAFGYKHTEEHKRYISALHKGRPHRRGYKHSPESIERMRVAALRDRAMGKGGAKKGQKFNLSDEQRDAKRLRMLGKKHSLGWKAGPEAKAKMRAAKAHNPSMAIQIIHLPTGEIFPSMLSAEKRLKTCRSTIRKKISEGREFAIHKLPPRLMLQG